MQWYDFITVLDASWAIFAAVIGFTVTLTTILVVLQRQNKESQIDRKKLHADLEKDDKDGKDALEIHRQDNKDVEKLFGMFMGDCPERMRSQMAGVKNMLFDEHSVPLYTPQSHCDRTRDEIKAEFKELNRKIDKQTIPLLEKILKGVNGE